MKTHTVHVEEPLYNTSDLGSILFSEKSKINF